MGRSVRARPHPAAFIAALDVAVRNKISVWGVLGDQVLHGVLRVLPGIDWELLAARPRAVWFQLGIRNDDAARAIATARSCWPSCAWAAT